MDAELTRAALAALRPIFGDVGIIAETPTPAGHRGSVASRLVLITDAGPRSVVVKTANTAPVRERAALELLRDLKITGVPVLLAVGTDPAMLIMEDPGTGGSLADRLRGPDPEAAEAAVYRWAEAIGALHAATLSAGPALRRHLGTETVVAGSAAEITESFDLDPPLGQQVGLRLGRRIDTMDAIVEDAIVHLTDQLREIGQELTPAAAAEMRRLSRILRVEDGNAGGPGALTPTALIPTALTPGALTLGNDDPWSLTSAHARGPGALTPGDACPATTVDAPDGFVLLDFEGADFRHVAWDAANLALPWPACRCGWRLPADVATAALARWRATIEPALAPHVVAGLDGAVRAATALWALTTVGRDLTPAVDEAPFDSEAIDAPAERDALRALIQHRLSVAADNLADGPLRELSLAALDATVHRWGDNPRALAPAWR